MRTGGRAARINLLECMQRGALSFSSDLDNSAIPLGTHLSFRQVFFGGEPWVLQCIDENMTVSPAFITAAKKISVTAPSIRFGVIDCAGRLPSNRTILERFKLPPVNYSASPTGFLFANSERPMQVYSTSKMPLQPFLCQG
jgi:hypothetical protein